MPFAKASSELKCLWFICLVHLGQQTHAASLAEKYRDFGVLIELCESSGDQDTLQRYMTQFTEQV